LRPNGIVHEQQSIKKGDEKICWMITLGGFTRFLSPKPFSASGLKNLVNPQLYAVRRAECNEAPALCATADAIRRALRTTATACGSRGI
jgi:hypothetical protein